MAGTHTPTGTNSNLLRVELEQLRRGDFAAGGKALTIGDSALAPEGVVGRGNVNAEPYYTGPSIVHADVNSVSPPTEPGRQLGKLTQVAGDAADTVQWFGPSKIISSSASSGSTTAPDTFTDATKDFVADGVQAGDLLLIQNGGVDTSAVGVIASVDSATQVTCVNIVGGLNTGDFGTETIENYLIIRPNAVQLFAIPGSGPVGQEQTFLFVTPSSTLHSNASPSLTDINTDRVRNIVQPKYSLDPSVDRSDAVFVSPAPHSDLTKLGYRVMLYPDDGTGTGPDLSSPIASINPVIDPTLPVDDQRMTIDFTAGAIRFSCAPALGGQIKVAGGTNATTDRLNLYAVFWAFDKTVNANTAAGLFVARSVPTETRPPARMRWDGATSRWLVHGSRNVGAPVQTTIPVSGDGSAGDGDADLRVLGLIGSAPTSLVQRANAGLISIGDGTTSFGDFNGVAALEAAVTFWQTYAPSVLSFRVHVKAGAYTVSNQIVVPAGSELVLVGDGRASTVTTFSTGGYAVSVAATGQLVVEDMTLVSVTPMQPQGSLRAKRSCFRNFMIYLQGGASPYVGSANVPKPAQIYAEDCEFDSHAGLYCLYVDMAAAATVKGFIFKECTFKGSATGDPIVRIEHYGTNACVVRDFYFDRCSITLGCVTSASATALTKGSGLVEVFLSGGSLDYLTVTNLNFIDTNVDFEDSPTIGNTILLHLMPLVHDATNVTTDRAIIGKVTIKGGRWKTPDFRGSDFVPFFLQCQKPVLENVTFEGGKVVFSGGYGVTPNFRGNGLYTNTQKHALRAGNLTYISSTTGSTAIGWATIAASGSAIEAIATPKLESGMVMHDVSFEGIYRLAGPAGALVLYGPNSVSGPANVDGVHIQAEGVGDINEDGGVPVDMWLMIVPGGSGTTSRGTNGSFKNITIIGNGEPATANIWAQRAFVILPDEGRLVLEDLVVAPTLIEGINVSACPAVSNTRAWGETSPPPLGGLHLIRPFLRDCAYGVQYQGGVGVGPYVISGLTFRGAEGPGTGIVSAVYFAFTTRVSDFRITNCDIYTNGRVNSVTNGIFVQGDTWPNSNSFGHITDNRVTNDCGAVAIGATSYQIRVRAQSSGLPNVNIHGNICTVVTETANGLGSIKLSRNLDAALSSPAAPGANGYIGVETGHSITVATQYNYATTIVMVRNSSILLTP